MLAIQCQACGIDNEAAGKCFACGSALSAAKPTEADRLTAKLTAFRTFAEFVAAMGTAERQKYTPTIYPNNTLRGRPTKARTRLIEIVRAAGFKVYDGNKVA